MYTCTHVYTTLTQVTSKMNSDGMVHVGKQLLVGVITIIILIALTSLLKNNWKDTHTQTNSYMIHTHSMLELGVLPVFFLTSVLCVCFKCNR